MARNLANSTVANDTASPTQQSHSREQTYDAPGARREGMLRVDAEVQTHEGYNSLHRLEVGINRKLGREKEYTEIGFMVAWIVDKKVKQPQKKKALWIEELLEQNDAFDSDGTHGLREACQYFYAKSGTPRAKLSSVHEKLACDKFVYIDYYELYGTYRTKGAGTQPMRLLLELLPKILQKEEGEIVPVMLPPARSESAELNHGRSNADVEAGVIRAYQRNDFEVWIHGRVEGGVTYMGRML